jgi:hypothetical protein
MPAPSTNLRLRQTTRQSFRRQATRRTPASPAVRPPAATAALHLTSVGPSGRGHGHRTSDTGRRTPDIWTLGRPHRTLDTVAWTGTCRHWALGPKTGRRTLAEDADRTTAWPAFGPSRAITPSDRVLGRLSNLNCVPVEGASSAREPCRLGSQATRRRETGSRTTGSARSLRRPRCASAHCSPAGKWIGAECSAMGEQWARNWQIWRCSIRGVG